MPEKMDLRTLKAILASEKADALASMSAAKLAEERADAMDYYLGDMSKDMPAPEGRSQAVSTDVADTVEGLMPSLMDILCGSDEVVEFEPVGPEDVQGAEQESDYVNHVFLQENDGFMTMYQFVKDQLLQKNGIVKVWWDERQEEQRETYLDQSDDAFALIAQGAQDGQYEITEHTVKESESPDPQSGQLVKTVTHDVTIVSTAKLAQAKVMGVPPEEFGIERGARTIRDCNYCYHEVSRSVGKLIEQGYDPEQIKSIPSRVLNDRVEALARDTVNENDISADRLNETARQIRLTEHYIRMDYEGTGRPCIYRVTTGGDDAEILLRDGEPDIVRVDVYPFASSTPVPMPHRFFGRSVHDLVADIQRIKTALIRGALDNLYLHNNPRVEVPEANAGPNTLDDLLVSRIGGVVRTKTGGGLNWQTVPDITGAIYPALEYFDATREWRTGVTRQGQGIDANALQNQSATAVNQAFTAAQARIKLIARIIAETGVRDMFALLHQVIRKHGTQTKTVRLRNQWVTVDPRNWKTRNDMTIRVGLGTGGKTERAAHLTTLLNIQKECLIGKLPIVTPRNVFNTVKELCKVIELKDVTPYMTDPQSPEGQQMAQAATQQPDPDVMKIQLQAQLDQKADERKAQIESVQAQADIATQDKKTQAEMIQSERDFQLKKELAIMQAQLDLEKFQREEARKDREHQQKLDLARETHQAGMQQAEFGMIASQQAHQQKMEQAASKESVP